MGLCKAKDLLGGVAGDGSGEGLLCAEGVQWRPLCELFLMDVGSMCPCGGLGGAVPGMSLGLC